MTLTLQPLVQFSSSLRDCLLLVLRKALFSINVEARKTAVEGYLLLLRKFTVCTLIEERCISLICMQSKNIILEELVCFPLKQCYVLAIRLHVDLCRVAIL